MGSMFTVHSLASGSSGNATLVRAGDISLLIDAGVGMRKLVTALAKEGLAPVERRQRLFGGDERDAVALGQRVGALNMVSMLVRDDRSAQIARRKTLFRQRGH